MRTWTAHVRAGAAPALVPEGFSWGAAILGPVWLLLHRAWIPAILVLCADIAVGEIGVEVPRVPLLLGLAWLAGLVGQDLRRWSLERRGFALVQVVAARDRDGAFVRLLDGMPELATTGFA